MPYTDRVDDSDDNTSMNNGFIHSHSPAPIPQDYAIKRPHCVICSMEEIVMYVGFRKSTTNT
eukprot:4321584-Ditylum_brightwellii.AAC.1